MSGGRSRAELVVELLDAYSVWVGLVALSGLLTLAAGVLFFGVSVPTVGIPRAWKVFGIAVVVCGGLGYFPVAKIIRSLYDPPKRYIVSLGLSGEPGIYELSPRSWEEVTVVEDELYQWEGMRWPTYEAEAFDPESLIAVGTWRGSEPDSELLRYEKRLEEVRQDLEAQADTSIDTEIQISSRVRQAVTEIGQAIIDEHASATTYSGERVADVLADIRKDVEADTGDPTPQRNGEKPTQTRGDSHQSDQPDGLDLEALIDTTEGGEPADD